MKCTNCGASLERSASFCGYCGTSLTKASAAGTQGPAFRQPALVAAGPAAAGASAPPATSLSDSDLKPYYQQAFAEIDAKGAQASPWNWAAFLFGAFWYFYRGLWAKGLLYILACISTGGLAQVVLFIYAGKFGTNDFYLLRRHGKQMW